LLDETLPGRARGEEFRVVERDGKQSCRRRQPRPEDGQALEEGRADTRAEAGAEQGQAVHQARVAALQRGRQLAAPRNPREEDGPRTPQRRQDLGEVVEQAAKAWGVAALLRVQAGAAAVEEVDGKARLRQPGAGTLVPAAVTLDAVDADDVRPRCFFSPRPWGERGRG